MENAVVKMVHGGKFGSDWARSLYFEHQCVMIASCLVLLESIWVIFVGIPQRIAWDVAVR